MKPKKVIAILLTSGIIASSTYAGVTVYQKRQFDSIVVQVQPVSYISTYDYGSTQSVYGNLFNEARQVIYLTSSQNIQEILVEDGQYVEAGTPLILLDMEKMQLDLTDMDLAIQQKRLDIENGIKRLNRLRNTTPYNPNYPDYPDWPPYWDDTTEETTEEEATDETIMEVDITEIEPTLPSISPTSEPETYPWEDPSESSSEIETDPETSEESTEESTEESSSQTIPVTDAEGRILIDKELYSIDQAQAGKGTEEEPYIFRCSQNASLFWQLIDQVKSKNAYAQIWIYNEKGKPKYILDLSLIIDVEEPEETEPETTAPTQPEPTTTPTNPVQPTTEPTSPPTSELETTGPTTEESVPDSDIPPSDTPEETQSVQITEEPTSEPIETPTPTLPPETQPVETSAPTLPLETQPVETPAPTQPTLPETQPVETPAPVPVTEAPVDQAVPVQEEELTETFSSVNSGALWLFSASTTLEDASESEGDAIQIERIVRTLTGDPADGSGWDISLPSSDDESFQYMTAEELAQEIRRQEISLRDMDLERRKMELDYSVKLQEMDQNTVTASIDGVVSIPQEGDSTEWDSAQPIMNVDAAQGYTIQGTVTESQLALISIGTLLDVNTYGMNGSNYKTAVVTEISDYPEDSNPNYYYGDSSREESSYAFTAYIEDGDGISAGDFAEISLNVAGSNSLFIDSMYVRKDSGKYYVWVANPETMLLEKRDVTIGRTLYDQYLEITSGLSSEDLIAVPFGKNIKEGVKTTTEVTY